MFTESLRKHYRVVAADDYPWFRGHLHAGHTPSVKPQDNGDPAGIYFFSKQNPPSGGAYNPKDWKETFEAKLNPRARVLELQSVNASKAISMLKKNGINVDSHDSLVQLVNTGEELENWEFDNNSVNTDDPKRTVRTLIGEWSGAWYHVLKSHFADSKKFAKFFIDLGYDAVHDKAGLIWSNEEEQLIVLKNNTVTIRKTKEIV